jgi:hypothetical protein
MEDAHCKPNPWVSLRCDQLILVNKAVNEKEQLEKGLEEVEEKMKKMTSFQSLPSFFQYNNLFHFHVYNLGGKMSL